MVALGASGCTDGGTPSATAPTSASSGEVTITKTPARSTTKKPKADGNKTSGATGKTTKPTNGAGSTKAGSGATKAVVPPLTKRTFVATDLGDQNPVKGSTIVLTFGNGSIIVKPGCNTLGGPATWENGTLSVGGGGLATTKKACSDALAQQDVWVQALLEAKPKLTLDGSTMTLDDGFSSMTLKEQN